MSRCYPFPPPGYQKKAPQLPADLAQPPKDKKDRKDKHKDKKKKKKKDGDTNGDTHGKSFSLLLSSCCTMMPSVLSNLPECTLCIEVP